MHRTPSGRSLLAPRPWLLALPLALPLLAHPATAQTTITNNGGVSVVPGGPKRVASSVAVISAMDSTGNADNAKAALNAARAALNDSPGYAPLPNAEYPALASNATAAALAATDWGYPFTASDIQKLANRSRFNKPSPWKFRRVTTAPPKR